MDNALTPILEKKAALEAERNRIKTRLDMIDIEIADHETAIRIFQRVTGKVEQKLQPSKHVKKQKLEKQSLPTKPDGVPTIPEMITTILERAAAQGHRALQPKFFLRLIQSEWWPEAPSEHIGPTLWRMAKAGRLNKEGDYYSLPQTNEATDYVPEEGQSVASEQEPAQGGEARTGGGT
jgi:hypothetical protein